MKRYGPKLVVRWFASSFGLWLAAGFLNDRLSYGGSLQSLLVAGLVLALINSFIRPIIVLLSLPAVLLSLGLFMIVVNGLTVLLASHLYDSLQITGFGAAMLAGVFIGLVNYMISATLEV